MVLTPSPAKLWQRLPLPVRLVVFAGVVVGVGMLSVRWFRPPDSTLAVWWPVAGVGLVGVLSVPRRAERAVLAVHLAASGLTNLLAGQRPLVALLLGVANAVQIATVVALLRAGGRDPRRLHEPADLGRFVLAAIGGALLIATLTGAIVAGLADGSFLATARSALPSHASALLLVGAIAMRGLPSEAEAGRGEVLVQWMVAVGVTSLVFAPTQRIGFLFLVVPALLWGALRASLRSVGVQLVTVATIAAARTLRGDGPLAFHPDTPVPSAADSVALVQLFLLSVALVMLTTVLVVQSRRDAAARIAARDRRAAIAYDRGLTGMLDLRADGTGLRIVRGNRIAASFLGVSDPALLGAGWCDRFVPADRSRLDAGVRALLEGRAEAWHGELEAEVDGRRRWFEVAVFPSVPDGVDAELTAQLLEVTERREREIELTRRALRDPLTGAANRVLLTEQLRRAIGAAGRDGGRVGVLFVDLDAFKPVNDRHGHAVGDQVLVAVVERITAVLRPADTVARLGGDEFVVVVPGVAGTEEARATVTRIRRAIEQPIATDAGELTVLASIGLAVGDAEADPRDLVLAADEAMYARKVRRKERMRRARRRDLEPAEAATG